jgi:hypothetical protein
MIVPLLTVSAMAGEPDCRVTEDDYYALRDSLRDLRRDVGHRLHVAGDAPRCARALSAVAGNDPLLGVRVIDAPEGDAARAVEISLYRTGKSCGAVLAPSASSGWTLVDVGDCTQSADPYRHTVTLGYWNVGGKLRSIDDRGGISGRLNTVVNQGLSLLVDGSVELSVNPKELDASVAVPMSWRLLGGFDATRDQLAGGYVGFRGGLQHVHVAGDLQRDAVFHTLLGHRWIGRGAVLQAGGGVAVSVPTEDYVEEGRTISVGPMLEVRLGIAP